MIYKNKKAVHPQTNELVVMCLTEHHRWQDGREESDNLNRAS